MTLSLGMQGCHHPDKQNYAIGTDSSPDAGWAALDMIWLWDAFSAQQSHALQSQGWLC